MKKIWVAVCIIVWSMGQAQSQTESLAKLSDDFWTWRAKHAPFTGDDVNRIERQGGTRDWSRASIDQRRNDLEHFEARWKKIDASHWPIPQQVDYRLIGSALSRVCWELDQNPRWKSSGQISVRDCQACRSKRHLGATLTFGFCTTWR